MPDLLSTAFVERATEQLPWFAVALLLAVAITSVVSRERRRRLGLTRFLLGHLCIAAVPLFGVIVLRSALREGLEQAGYGWWSALWRSLFWMMTFKVNAKSQLAHLWAEAGPLLAKAPDVVNAIQHLTENPPIANWVERGLELHDHKENCEFCGNKLAAERLDALRAHFSKAQADFKSELQGFLGKASAARLGFAKFNPLQISGQFREKSSADRPQTTSSRALLTRPLQTGGGRSGRAARWRRSPTPAIAGRARGVAAPDRKQARLCARVR